jgi:hypothetical protein
MNLDPEILYDGSKFVLLNYAILRLSPMHVYWSSFPFAPTDTVLFRQYKDLEKVRLQVVSGFDKPCSDIDLNFPFFYRLHTPMSLLMSGLYGRGRICQDGLMGGSLSSSQLMDYLHNTFGMGYFACSCSCVTQGVFDT